MIKITNKTRIRVSKSKLHKYLNISSWGTYTVFTTRHYMETNFGMIHTSTRAGVYFFSIKDKIKYSLFLLKHSDLITKY